MTLKLYNEWTWTEWYGTSIKKESISIPPTFKWIRNYEDFRSKVKWKKSEFRNIVYKKLDIFLQKLNEKTWVDPIEYLYHLYYEQELSTLAIYDRLAKLWWYNNKNRDTFEKMFKKTFWWELRDGDIITEIWKRKIIEANKKTNETVKEVKKQKQGELYWLFESQDNLEQKNELKWKNQMEKLNYFFVIYWFKDKNISLKDYLFKFKEIYWLKNLTDVVNKLLAEKWYNLKLSKWRFSELFSE